MSDIQSEPKEKEPVISVVIPVYGDHNYREYLAQCIESVRSQSYPHLEIILCDDGSPEETAVICDEYANVDDRIRVIHKEHSGLAATRNAALDAVTGDYVAFVDGDDWIKPDTYERMVAVIQNNAEVDVVCCAAERYPKKDDMLTFAYYPTGTIIPGSEMLRKILLDEIGSQVVIGLYKRSCWDGVRFPVGRLYEDIPTTYKSYLSARKVAFLAEPFYVYRTNDSGISRTPVPIKSYHIFLGFEDHFNAAKQHAPDIAGKCCAKAAHFAISTYFHYCAEKPKELESTIEHVLRFLNENKAVTVKYLDVIPRSRRIALRCYYTSPVLFERLVRVFAASGLQKRLGFELK